MAVFDAQPGRVTPPEPVLSSAQRGADDAELYEGLEGVAGIVSGAHEVTDLLRDVAEFAAHAIPGADGASIAVIDLRVGPFKVKTWAATELIFREIDTAQYDELHEGPCITCMQSRRPTVSGSLGSDSRWPHFRWPDSPDAHTLRARAAVDRRRTGNRLDQCLCQEPRRVRRARGAARVQVRQTRRRVGIQRSVVGHRANGRCNCSGRWIPDR